MEKQRGGGKGENETLLPPSQSRRSSKIFFYSSKTEAETAKRQGTVTVVRECIERSAVLC